MTSCGLLVEIEAARDQEIAVERLLENAVPLVETEPGTTAWFAVRFRRYHYGIFDVFPDEAAREIHLAGGVAQALAERQALFAKPPVISRVDILADKLPQLQRGRDHKALLLKLVPHDGREQELADFLRSARPIVLDEPDTTAWFALRFESGEFAIFDAFANNRGRIKHLLGKVPRALVKHTRLLGGMPKMSMLDVQAETFRLLAAR